MVTISDVRLLHLPFQSTSTEIRLRASCLVNKGQFGLENPGIVDIVQVSADDPCTGMRESSTFGEILKANDFSANLTNTVQNYVQSIAPAPDHLPDGYTQLTAFNAAATFDPSGLIPGIRHGFSRDITIQRADLAPQRSAFVLLVAVFRVVEMFVTPRVSENIRIDTDHDGVIDLEISVVKTEAKLVRFPTVGYSQVVRV